MTEPKLQGSDKFIVGRDNQTYKSTFAEIQQSVGLHIGKRAPSNPIDGTLWVDLSTCPPQLFIYSEACLSEDPTGPWYPIVGELKEEYLEQDASGNVYVDGNFIVGIDVIAEATGYIFTPEADNKIEVSETGEASVPGTVYVKGIVRANETLAGFTPDSEVEMDSSGNLEITGDLIVRGQIINIGS